MADNTDLPLPDITPDNFRRAWLRFELVAKAKKWSEQEQLGIIPTLLRDKLLDIYDELPDTEKSGLKELKEALEKATGAARDPLAAGKQFSERNQGSHEKVADYATSLKKIFKEAYPKESGVSTVLSQRFLAGLKPSIRKQVLLKGRPSTLDEAIKTASDIEFALDFGDEETVTQQPEGLEQVFALQKQQRADQETVKKLQEAVELLTKQLEAHETRPSTSRQRYMGGRGRGRHRINMSTIQCFKCHEYGHFQYHCPLNEQQPVPRKGGDWLPSQ